MFNSKNKVIILYSNFEEKLSDTMYGQYLNLLPDKEKERNQRYIRWQDQHSHLFGRLLLKKGFELFGSTYLNLSNLNYTRYKRPYIAGGIDFNISHSGEYVMCAIGSDLRLGVDIEEIKEVDFDDFKKIMTTEQWNDILQSKDFIRSFYKYWTIKESVIKADGRGLLIPLQDIQVDKNNVLYESQTWYLNELNIDNRYSSYLTTDQQNIKTELKYVNFLSIKDQSF